MLMIKDDVDNELSHFSHHHQFDKRAATKWSE